MVSDLTNNFSVVQFVLLCLTIYAITFVVRLTVEGVTSLFKKTRNFKQSRAWRDWLLRISPIVLGGTFAAMARSFPYPIMIEETVTRVAMGMVAGLLSSLVYAVAKKRIKAATSG